MKNVLKWVLILFISIPLLSCKKDSPNEPDEPFINLNKNLLEFDRYAESKELTLETNVNDIAVDVSAFGRTWCFPELTGNKLVINVLTNPSNAVRNATVTLKGESAKAVIEITQKAKPTAVEEIGNDIMVKVSAATATSEQPGEDISKSIDGDYKTIYHSSWNNTDLPVILTYYFNDVSTIDYLLYYPRTEGNNGIFKEFDLYVAQDGKSIVKYNEYNFNGSGGRVSFNPPLVNPTQIQFVVKSGVNDFVSCAEMEFYQKDPAAFNYLDIFSDHSCSELKEGITKDKINAISNDFFKDLAMSIFLNEYDSEFRVQSYKPYQHPDIMAAKNKTNPYSLRDNPTGIYVNRGEEIIVFVKDIYAQNISLLVQNLEEGFGGITYPLSTGLNKLKTNSDGLLYVMYHTNEATEPSVKINIATGKVNGYFDSQKHTKEDWSRILAKANYKDFDVLGKYAHLTFGTEYFKVYTPDGLALIDKYDELVYLEQDFMGLVKYDKMFKNRMNFVTEYDDTKYMYASSYRTAYVRSTFPELCNVSKLSTTSVWGPAHEVGHCNQTRPGLKWGGMTEVTNNIHSLYVQTKFGNTSRIQADNTYDAAYKAIVEKGIAHNACDNVFYKLIPFWQLKLYLCDALGKKDFYKDLYEHYRTHPDLNSSIGTHGIYQLDFVKNACNIAQLDLTEFFEKWGFLTPIDTVIDDYGNYAFTITQKQINNVKSEIALKGYSKPGKDFTKITDSNIETFK